MTELDAVRDAYVTLVGCHTVTSELVRKSTKGPIFHGTVFQGQHEDEARPLLAKARAELNDWAIVSLVAVFERILFEHNKSPLRSKASQKGTLGLHQAVEHFARRVSPRVYEDVGRLCRYRDWVAHGKRWEKPASADPISSYQRLLDFLNQAGLSTK